MSLRGSGSTCCIWALVTTVVAVAASAAPMSNRDLFVAYRPAAATISLDFEPSVAARVGLVAGQTVVMNGQVDVSDMSLTTKNGSPFSLAGGLRTVGQFSANIPQGPLAGALEFGDLYVAFSGRKATLQDGRELGRPLFELAPDSTSIQIDASNNALVITSTLVVAESFATEILRDARAAGTAVGTFVLRSQVAVEGVDQVERPGNTSPAGGGQRLIGPDVITSTIGSSFSEYGSYDPGTGRIGAYAVTTVSCNIGDQDAIWIDCTSGPNCNQHPVIGQNMYRHKTVSGAGRFEMIGMSWLKHGWCAADAPNCGSPYVPNGSCDWLGLFATDTYGASLNAAQDDLGPRSEIQPWTGVFPYPYIKHWNSTGTGRPDQPIFKRLQILNSDLDPALNAGALYYCEVQYVHTQEQEARRYNNVSYRRSTVGSLVGTPPNVQYNLSFADSTVVQKACIEVWPTIESGVTLVNADVIDGSTVVDGRFVLGYKVSDLGGGTWHYEYALYNMNADRAADGFIVPCGVGTTISNSGFHDVFYHSDEPYDGTDWSKPTNGVTTGTTLTWAAQAFSPPENANALRWGTTYNFRFDANVPPTAGNVTIDLFKAGTPSTLTVAAQVPSVPCADPDISPIANDSVACGAAYNSSAPTVSGTPPFTWNLVAGPGGMSVNPDGSVSWASPAASWTPYTVTVRAESTCGLGADQESWQLTVLPGDFDGDGVLGAGDISDFVDALVNPMGECPADVNLDTQVDGFDIQEFVDNL